MTYRIEKLKYILKQKKKTHPPTVQIPVNIQQAMNKYLEYNYDIVLVCLQQV